MVIKEYIDKKLKAKMYQDLKKLNAIEFQKRMKYEFALRDSLNIKVIDNAISFYVNHKKDFNNLKQQLEIIPYENLIYSEINLIDNYQILLNIVNKINFFSFEVNNIEEYKHPLVKDELLDIFNLLYFINTKIDKSFEIKTLDSEEFNTTTKLTKTVFKYDNNIFYLKSEKNIDDQNNSNYYTIQLENPYLNLDDEKILSKELNNSVDKYYDHTAISIAEEKMFKKKLNIKLELNLGLPIKELKNIIESLSKQYKNGDFSKNVTLLEEQSIFKEFKKVGMKYIEDADSFILLLFMFDTIKNKAEFGNPQISVIEKELSKKFEIGEKTLSNLRTVYMNTLNNQLYLQL